MRLLLVVGAGLALSTAAFAESQSVTFEDVFGTCSPTDLVAGPGDPVVDGVRIDTPDRITWNCGEEASLPPSLGNPFDTDALILFTFGDGALITFPQPIVNLSFTAGLHVNMVRAPTFELRVEDEVITVFAASLVTPTYVNVGFERPVSSVTIAFVSGSSSLLGIDDLTFAYATSTCSADLDGDGLVDGTDLGLLLGAWGTATYDLDADATTLGSDLAIMLGAWGACR